VPEPSWRLVRARRDAVPDSVRRFGARARRNRLRAARPWLIAAGVVVVLVAAGAAIWFTPLVAVREVQVQGAALVTVGGVRTAAAVAPDTPLIRVRPGQVERRILATLPPVRRVEVSRHLPSTLTIRVYERSPAAVVARGADLWLIDATGVPYLPVAQQPADLALLKIPAPGPTDPATRGALIVLAALPADLRGRLAALSAEGPARIHLELTDGRTIIWGDATENEAKAKAALVLLPRPEKTLNVSAPDLVTVR
jgi:cell division protein FtsQ